MKHILFTLASAALLLLLLASTAHACDASEAEILALELSGQVLAPPSLVSQIEADLAAIRAYMPHMATLTVFPNWAAGELIIKLTDEAFADFEQGLYTGLDELNAIYGPTEVLQVSRSSTWFLLGFESCYNPDLLEDIYTAATGVEFAEPNSILGDGDDIWTTELGTYTFKQGWGDCIAGCIYEHFWTFKVDGGVVEKIEDYGDPVRGTDVAPIPSGYALESIAPNPFNPATVIQFSVQTPGWVRLQVIDARGRRVRGLIDRDLEAGPDSIRWDGLDDLGKRMASGVYFAVLRVSDGPWVSQAMTLLQ